jgi:hypothetical protein
MRNVAEARRKAHGVSDDEPLDLWAMSRRNRDDDVPISDQFGARDEALVERGSRLFEFHRLRQAMYAARL